MSDQRDGARELLRELVAELLAAGSNGNLGSGPVESAGPVPQVPAPPVAAVLRPSGWSGPAAPGEVIGDIATISEEGLRSSPPNVREEPVKIDNDEDLERFARSLAKRLENPRERSAIRAGQVRFTLRRAAPTSAASSKRAPVMRIEKGAVTERVIREAAEQGMRLVLARGAVLTPLARDNARALRVEIEREAC